MNFTAEDITKIVDALIKIAPGAGILIVGAICFRIMGETPASLLRALASVIWGWKKRNGRNDKP